MPSGLLQLTMALGRYNAGALFAKHRHARTNLIVRAQKALRPQAGIRSGRRAGGDDVAAMQRHERADVADQPCTFEDHLRRRAALHRLAVQLERDVERLRIGDLLSGDKIGTDRTERVRRLAAREADVAAIELEATIGEVVEDAIAGNVTERIRFAHVARGRADHHGTLGLPVTALRTA